MRGLTQEGLAIRANTTFQQISRLEKGDRKLSQEWLERLGSALSMRPASLIEDGDLTVAPGTQGGDQAVDLHNEAAWMRLYDELTPDERRAAIRMWKHVFGKAEVA